MAKGFTRVSFRVDGKDFAAEVFPDEYAMIAAAARNQRVSVGTYISAAGGVNEALQWARLGGLAKKANDKPVGETTSLIESSQHVCTFCIVHRVRPVPGSPQDAKPAGGKAVVFVVDDDQERAEWRALEYLEGEGWESIEADEIHLVHREACEYNSRILSLFDLAQERGIVCIIDAHSTETLFHRVVSYWHDLACSRSSRVIGSRRVRRLQGDSLAAAVPRKGRR